ncbi:MAG TPA: 4-alpha-glucanotransferase [Bdellovibrionales bacterium]|nr:MAG: 4-alpha-glucanotransferase [Bdellovibrionales bacterium GWA1_52_35]OFZ43258.1 MAG: 4-alpha-glucanotransferase [Bdellovibrionales bacterium GWC1_52_8]HAR41248.1 4-alpha-glucanotransferase [Bdellovibrionales bacterium]HCM41260.1 4-alpha-glucanotransferase [Bdellovibrionales bacterium]
MATQNTDDQITRLRELASVSGVQTSYKSAFGTVVETSTTGIRTILNALGGTQIQSDLSNIEKVCHEQLKSYWQQLSEPVIVAWEGRAITIPVRFAMPAPKKQLARLTLEFENGKTLKTEFEIGAFAVTRQEELAGISYLEKTITLKRKIPFGYHSGTISFNNQKHSFLMISSPMEAFRPKNDQTRWLGLFAPLYAVHSEQTWGIGDFSDLKRLIDWSYKNGCDFVGTLPMLSIFNDKPLVEPSPYSPLSRLHWCELYVDPRIAEEWRGCKEAQTRADSDDFRKQLAELNSLREVDYQSVARLKRGILEPMAELFFAKGRNKSRQFKEFLKTYPTVQDFAAFRATCDTQNTVWSKWPERMKNGDLRPGDYKENDQRYHLYTQWLVHQQLSNLQRWSKKKGKGIYLDFPLSAHADGYDVWRERESFSEAASAGCPPDPAHVHGQDWGILPLNPKTIRGTGYRYFRNCLENHMRYSGMLRLDHVMCFYRLYWVPRGLTAKDGVYIRYNLDEFFALLVLESHRNRCVLIGEDLGTVPQEIRDAMTEHNILRMYIQQRRLSTNPAEALPEVPEGSICGLNTHDMPPFAAFWQGLDILDKMDLGYFGPNELPAKQKSREEQKAALVQLLLRKKLLKSAQAELPEILKAVLQMTAADPVKVMQINLEDLWLETLPQNVPGTWKERPNWRRKHHYGLEDFPKLSGTKELLANLAKLRKKAEKKRKL